ncbi:DUF4123 domain-containing protein [Lysobacter cavernae]|uniref:DUF4123 domain-containing protein n=1 Tax=Lysobacter cavernae TaxID=1685901 RepID=A0ABV7RSV2_9GAMM
MVKIPPLQLTRARLETKRYLLVDGAQCKTPSHLLRQSSSRIMVAPLFSGLMADKTTDVSPYLVQLLEDGDPSRQLQLLAASITSVGAVTVIETLAHFHDLLQRLTRRLDLVLGDDTGSLARYFDGRVLPHLAGALTQEQHAAFFSLARRWWYVAPDLSWKVLDGSYTEMDAFTPPLRLDEQQRNAVIDGCYPHTMIEHFALTDGELLDTVLEMERYDFFRQVLDSAKTYGITGGPDAVRFCAEALLTGFDFHLQPEWIGPLAEVRAGRRRLRQVITDIYAN